MERPQPNGAVPFFKLSGSGNDFIALVEPATAPSAAEIRAYCRRGLSLGADGLFVLRRQASVSTVAMEYWNADGSAAALCLNGAACAARLSFALGWAASEVTVETAAGRMHAVETGQARVRLQVPLAPGVPREIAVAAGDQLWRGHHLTVGVPHFVLAWPELEQAPLATLGRELRDHEAFSPEGTNVDFVCYEHPHALALRTLERGVAEETLACGTGVLAAVAAGLFLGRVELPVSVRTASGLDLEVDGEVEGSSVRHFTLEGDARLVARGELLEQARCD
jgi:diaminopimelate epimerase